MKLSILICTIEERNNLFFRLYNKIERQIFDLRRNDIEIVFERDNRQMKVGAKRNKLIQRATGDYICFIDDDDDIATDYLSLIMIGIDKNIDCVGLTGMISINGSRWQKFIHSLSYRTIYEKDGIYYRPPNHLNPIKKSIAEKVMFPCLNFGEDSNYCMELSNSRLIRSEYFIDKPIYYYKYNSQHSATNGR